MAQTTIPNDLVRFIMLGIPSVPYLEAMLLLRSEADYPWDAKRAAQRLYLSDSVAQSLLDELCSKGVVEVTDHQAPLFRYHPQSDELAQTIDLLARVYAENLIEVTNLIHSKTNRKAQQFADAFLWKKDP
ncbi:hypothetical protein [Janthinobacterium sp. 17J80-10]|uniref:hypothetical protein n=1 Tax=Janthinobacterium sp. 17J80-10 TaxID=2497863 RepID=UPI0010059AF5|nr:hypothetical protein [Janthinobacterium sp. 17J80-10]QAU33430.1 hypothetical protein EKL02_04095 [Janthinobacterium sp. 17J80-10]